MELMVETGKGCPASQSRVEDSPIGRIPWMRYSPVQGPHKVDATRHGHTPIMTN